MPAEAALVRTWRAGAYTCTLTMRRPRPGETGAAVIEWEPHQPRRLTDAEMRQYRAGRDLALAALAETLGITVALLEV